MVTDGEVTTVSVSAPAAAALIRPGATRVAARSARPGTRLLTAVAALAAALVVGIGIGLPLLGIGSFSGVDLLRTYEPWRSGVDTGTAPRLPTVSDTVDVVLPGHRLFGEELRDGNVAEWNPLVSGGTAFGSGTGVGFWTPLNLPYLLLPTWLAPAYVKLLEMLVAIGGTFLFLRRLSLARAAALLGGILFASSGFMVTWTNWPHTQVAALIPALFWTVERFAQRRTVPAAVPIAVVVALLLLGGFPAVTGYALYAAAPYLLLRLARLTGRSPRDLLRGAATAGGALALGTGAVAIVLLPFLAQLRDLGYLTERAQVPELHLPFEMLFTAAVWRAFGTETGGDGVPYWGPITQIEGLSFVGAGALVLVGFALLRRPGPGVPRGVRGYFAVATLVAVVLGYVGGPALALAQHLPVFSDNPVYRIRSVLGFLVAVLAAVGFDALLRSRSRSTARRLAVEVAGWLLAGAVAYLAAKHVLFEGYLAGQGPYVKRQLLWAALPAGLVLLAGVAAGARTRIPRPARLVALAAVPLVVAVECLSLLVPFWPRIPRADFYPETGAHRYLEQHLGAERYGAKGLTLLSGTNSYYGLRNVTGHAFTAARWRDLLLTLDPEAFPTPGFSRFSGRTDAGTMASPLLDVLSVRYFGFGPQDPVIGARASAGPAGPGLLLQPGRPVVVPIGAGPVRGVGPEVTRAARPTDPRAALELEILDARGTVVARNSRRLYDSVGATRLVVPVAGEALGGPLSARLTLRSDGPLRVAGGALPRLDVTRPRPADGLRLVYAGDGAVLYERGTALPRVRWADHAVVVPDRANRLRLLASTRDRGRVVLDAPPPGRTPGSAPTGSASTGSAPTGSAPTGSAPTGSAPTGPGPAGPAPAAGAGSDLAPPPADVRVLTDGTDGSITRVRAPAAGFLVVADAAQQGWEATVDGRRVPLLPADHALVAVPVPAGAHEVGLRYVPPGRTEGAAVSAVSVLVLLGAAAGPALVRRRRRRTGAPTDD